MEHSTAVAVLASREIAPLSSRELEQRVQQIQQVMHAVMKLNVHYGKIPGTDKPSLWRPGAEILALTFHLSGAGEVEILREDGEIGYRVKTPLYDSHGRLIAVGWGECWTSEEKFAWRAALCQEHDISEVALYRLKREDETFLAAVHEFTEEMHQQVGYFLGRHVETGLQTLRDLLDLDIKNFSEETGPNGGKVVTRRIDPKMVSERRLAADALLNHWQRLSEHRQAQYNWERVNFGPSADDFGHEGEEDEDEEDAA